ncbi:YfhO family protein, partial [bacterium]|nr:YfhO family protein [bacterium]
SKVTTEHGTDDAQNKARNVALNYPDLQKGLNRTFIIGIALSLLILLLTYNKLKPWHVLLVLIPLFVYDTWSVDKGYLSEVPPPNKYYAPDQVINYLKQDNTIYRVFNLHYNKNSLCKLNGIQILGGYGPNPLARYQQFIGAGKSVMFNPKDLLSMPYLLNLLNAKYIIGQSLPEDLSRYDERSRAQILGLKNYFRYFQKVYDTGRYTIYKNLFNLERAYVVPDYRVAASPEEALIEVKKPEFNPLSEVILEKDPGVKHSTETAEGAGRAEISVYSANKIVCRVTMNMPGFLVLSENYHPDWKAYVDGKKQEIFAANYAFRAVYLDKGDHEVVIVYESKYWKIGKIISLIGLIIVAAIFVFTFISRKKRT